MFSVEMAISTLHSWLQECFAKEPVFLEVIDTLLGITGSTEHKWATHRAEGYFIEDDRLWKLGGATPTQAVSCRECIMRDKATQLA